MILKRRVKKSEKKSNLKNITYIIILFIILTLFFTGYSIGKNISQATVNAEAKVAEPIIEVEANSEISITQMDKEGKYTFYVRNFNETGKITETKIKYTLQIKDNIEEEMKKSVEYELLKNGKKVELKNQEIQNLELTTLRKQEDRYDLKIKFNGEKVEGLQDIIGKVQVQIHSQQAKM